LTPRQYWAKDAGSEKSTGPHVMHILIIPSWYYTKGNPVYGSFFREQTHALKRAGHKMGVIKPERSSVRLLRDSIAKWPHFIEIENDNGVPTYRHHGMAWVPSMPHRKAFHWYWAGHSLFKKYCSDHGLPDIIHAHSSLYAGVLGMWLKQRHQLPLIITEHSTAFALKKLKPLEMRFAERAFSSADARIVVSPQLGNLLTTIFGNSIKPWTYIPNAIDNLFANYQPPVFQHDRSEFRWLNIAYLLKKKGQSDLIKAFAAAFKNNKKVKLRIAGDGPLENELKNLAAMLGVQDQIKFLGRIDRSQVLDELAASDAFVLSSHYETFGVVLIEALAMGKPVVATACGGPEYIVNKRNGILVPPHHGDQLAQAMTKLKSEISRYDAGSIRQDCIQRFGEKAVVWKIEQIYSDVLKNKTRSNSSETF
jgi:glycosyltransferase involved in cell wall biosynthesis